MAKQHNILATGAVPTKKAGRLVDDMQRRNEALVDDRIVHEVVLKQENALSPYSLFSGDSLFSAVHGFLPGSNPSNLSVKTIGHDMAFIARKEICRTSEHIRVVGNSDVRDTIDAGYTFELDLSYPLDPEEHFMLEDGETQLFVHSRQPSSGSGYTHTVSAISAQGARVTVTGLRELLQVGNVVTSTGNSKGEASRDSNTLRTPGEKAVYYYNLMKTQRYKTQRTGAAASDKIYTYTRQVNGELVQEFVELDSHLVRGSMKQLDMSLLFSKMNFDPQTFEIITHNQGTNYSERPIYAGLLQQLSQARHKFGAFVSGSNLQNLKVLENIHSTMVNAGYLTETQAFGIIALGPSARRWVVNALLYGGFEKSARQGIQFTKEVGANNKIDGGFQLGSYTFTTGAEAVIYDVASSMTADYRDLLKGVKTFTYDGVSSPVWANKIYFVPLGREDKLVNFYPKQTTDPITGNPINRGLLFATQRGITGTGGNGISADALNNASDQELTNIFLNQLRSGASNVNSFVDADEYHVLTDHTILVNVDGLIELTLINK